MRTAELYKQKAKEAKKPEKAMPKLGEKANKSTSKPKIKKPYTHETPERQKKKRRKKRRTKKLVDK